MIKLKRQAIYLIIAALSPFVALAAAANEGQSQRTDRPIFSGQVDVEVTNIEVFVTNRRGIPITGLEAKDFEVLQDGEPVEITNFYAVENGEIIIHSAHGQRAAGAADPSAAPARAPAAEPATRMNLVVYIDLLFSRTAALSTTLGEIERFLRRSLREEDRVMVIIFSGSMRVLTSFDDSQETAFKAIEKIRSSAAHGDLFDAQVNDILDLMATPTDEKVTTDMVEEMVQDKIASGAEEVRLLTRRAMRGLHATVAMLAAGCPGRKAILMISDGAPANPLQGIAQEYTTGVIGPNRSIRAAPRGLVDIVALANASGVTMYTVAAGGLSRNDTGVITPDVSGRSIYGRSDLIRERSFIDEADSTNTLQILAAGTGGVNVIKPAPGTLRMIANDLNSYYAIGVRSGSSDLGGHKLEVSVKNRSAKVRHRRWHTVLEARDRLAGRTLAALEIPASDNSIDLSCQPATKASAGSPEKGSSMIVPLTLRFAAAKVGLVPEGDEWHGSLRVFMVARQKGGKLSPIKELTIPLRLSNEALGDGNLRRFALRSELPLEPGEAIIAVTAYDEVSGVASTITTELELDRSGAVTSDVTAPGISISRGPGDAGPEVGSPAA